MVAKQALVWGGTGFLGRHLCSALHADGWSVTVLTRQAGFPRELADTGVSRVVYSCKPTGNSPDLALVNAIAECPVIFNCAGVSGAASSNANPVASLEGNCLIQAGFLRACEMAGTAPHIVFASSRLVYSAGATPPVDEYAPLGPRSIYAAHKLCVEHYHKIAALRGKISFSICRISNPYGMYDCSSFQGYGFINELIRKGRSGQPLAIYGDGSQLRDYIHISDLTAALKACGSHLAARNEIFNIGCGKGLSIIRAAEEISALTGVPVVHVPWPVEDALVESGDYVASIAKAKSLLGFDPAVSFRDGVRELLGSRKTGTGELGTAEHTAAAWV